MAGSFGVLHALPPEVRLMMYRELFQPEAAQGRYRADSPMFDLKPCKTRTALLRTSNDVYTESLDAFHAAFLLEIDLELESRRVITGSPKRTDYIIEHQRRKNTFTSRTVPDPTGEYYCMTVKANRAKRPLLKPLTKLDMKHVRILRIRFWNPSSANGTGAREWDPDTLYVLQDDPGDPTPTWEKYVRDYTNLQRLYLYMNCSRNIHLGDDRSVQLLSDTTTKLARPLLSRNYLERFVARTPGCSDERCTVAVRQALGAAIYNNCQPGCHYRLGEWIQTGVVYMLNYVNVTPEEPKRALVNEQAKVAADIHPTTGAPLYVQWPQFVPPRTHRPNPIWVRRIEP